MRISTLKTRIISNNLRKKGFVEDVNNHYKLNYRPNGKKSKIRTVYSHGKSEVGEPLISLMAKELYLSKSQFIELVSCTMSGEEYSSIVKDKL